MEQEIIYTRTGQPHMIYKGSFSPILCRPDRRDADRTKLTPDHKPCSLYNAGSYCGYCNGPEYCSSLETYTPSIWGTPDWARP